MKAKSDTTNSRGERGGGSGSGVVADARSARTGTVPGEEREAEEKEASTPPSGASSARTTRTIAGHERGALHQRCLLPAARDRAEESMSSHVTNGTRKVGKQDSVPSESCSQSG